MEYWVYACYFVVYSFLGWVVEVAFHALTMGKFVNRGMLEGPYCPIYGFGVLGILLLLEPLKGQFWFLFLGSVLLCSLVELVGGFALDRLFHQRWWDYSELPFNIGGYICLSFSIYWGIGGTILIHEIHPLFEKFFHVTPNFFVIAFAIVGLSALLMDAIITISSILKWNRVVEALSKEQSDLKNISDTIGQKVASSTLHIEGDVKEKREELQLKKQEISEAADQWTIKKEELFDQLEDRRKERKLLFEEKRKQMSDSLGEALENLPKSAKRRMEAFPRLKGTKSMDQDEVIQLMKKQSKHPEEQVDWLQVMEEIMGKR